MSFRSFYLPWEFRQITVILIYVAGPENVEARNKITDSFNNCLPRFSDQPILILGDVNSCDYQDICPNCISKLFTPLDVCHCEAMIRNGFNLKRPTVEKI